MTNSTIHPPALLDEKEAAAYISTTSNNLRLARHTGELFKGISPPPHIRCGRSIRYSRVALDKWLDTLPQYSSNADAKYHGVIVHCNANISGQSP